MGVAEEEQALDGGLSLCSGFQCRYIQNSCARIHNLGRFLIFEYHFSLFDSPLVRPFECVILNNTGPSIRRDRGALGGYAHLGAMEGPKLGGFNLRFGSGEEEGVIGWGRGLTVECLGFPLGL